MQIKLARKGYGVLCNVFQFLQGHMVLVDEKNNIIEIGIKASVQFAERNAIRISYMDF